MGCTTIHPFLDSASPPRNGVRLHLTFLRLATLVGIGHEAPGKGQRANRNALGPSPGLKAVKEQILSEKSILKILSRLRN